MSQTFYLVCHESQQALWVGQGRGQMTHFYWGAEDAQRLGRFLKATAGKSLVLMCSDTEGQAFEEYERFEEPSEGAAP